MKPVKEWFGLGPYDENEGYQYHWYNKCYEFHGTRIVLRAGDLMAEHESEYGHHEGPEFNVELKLCQEDVPEFYLPENPDAKYDVHWFHVTFWRWGIMVTVRGKVYE